MAYARNGDVEIYFETFGDSSDPALLLINGLGSQCIMYRTEWCEKFAAEGFYVIRFDNRDAGLSTKFDHFIPDFEAMQRSAEGGPAPEVAYLLSDMAADAIAVLDELGIERAHVMGVSMGGMIVQTMAIERPERVISLTSVMSHPGDPDVGDSAPGARELLTAPAAPGREGVIERALLSARTWGSPACYDEERIAAVAGEAYDRSFNPLGVVRQIMAIGASGSRSAALSTIDIPTLVMHGDKDNLIDISGGRRTAEVIPGARFVVMEGMGHDYPPQYWDRWIQLVTDHARAAEGRMA